jgi:hypothetical protein
VSTHDCTIHMAIQSKKYNGADPAGRCAHPLPSFCASSSFFPPQQQQQPQQQKTTTNNIQSGFCTRVFTKSEQTRSLFVSRTKKSSERSVDEREDGRERLAAARIDPCVSLYHVSLRVYFFLLFVFDVNPLAYDRLTKMAKQITNRSVDSNE